MSTILVLCLLASTIGAHAQELPIEVLSAPNIKRLPSTPRLRELATLTAARLGVPMTDFPHIVFMFDQRRTAGVRFIPPNTKVFVESIERKTDIVYEVWVVDDTSDEAVTLGIAMVLNVHARLDLPESVLRRVRDEITHRVRATVSVRDLLMDH